MVSYILSAAVTIYSVFHSIPIKILFILAVRKAGPGTGTTTVTGSGTSFLTDLVANMVITDNLGNYIGTISSVTNATTAILTASATYSGAYQANGNRDLMGTKHFTFYDNQTAWTGILG